MGAIRSRVLYTSSHTVNSMRTVKIFTIAVALTLGSSVPEFSEVLSSASMGDEVEALSKAKTKTTYGGTISGAVSFVANGAFSGGFAHMEEEELELELPQLEGKAKAVGEAALSEVTCNSGAKFKIATSGGQKNCAKCIQDGGALPCDRCDHGKGSGYAPMKCPDSQLKNGMWYYCWRIGKRCVVREYLPGPTATVTMTTKWKGLFSVDAYQGNKGTVMTKRQAIRPPNAELNIGVMALKRIVVNQEGKADTYKEGHCVKCPPGVVPFKSFEKASTQEEVDEWWNKCFMEFSKALDKKPFACPDALQGDPKLLGGANKNDVTTAKQAFGHFMSGF